MRINERTNGHRYGLPELLAQPVEHNILCRYFLPPITGNFLVIGGV